jgi:hypothetical protein
VLWGVSFEGERLLEDKHGCCFNSSGTDTRYCREKTPRPKVYKAQPPPSSDQIRSSRPQILDSLVTSVSRACCQHS